MPRAHAPSANTPTTLAADQRYPTALALQGEWVYWTDAIAGTVMRVSRQGGAASVLARGLACPLSLALDDAWIYVALSDEDGAIARIPLGGGRAQRIARGQVYPMDVAVDDARVYWTTGGDDRDNGQVWSAPKAGGAPALIAAGEVGPQGIGVDANGVYWLTRYDYIRRAEKADGALATLYRPSEPVEDCIAAGERGDAPPSASDGALMMLSQAPFSVRRIVVANEHVYWQDVSGAIVEVVHSGEEPVEPMTRSLIVQPDAPGNVAVDGQWVYWTLPDEGRVARVPHAGGRMRVCAAGERRPLAIAVDDVAIYWSVVGAAPDFEGGAIRVLRK